MVQMIALDLDGTLLQPDSTLSAAAEDALTKAISQGICIVVASGRAFTALPEKIRHFAGIRYAVTSNGAAVPNCLPENCCVHGHCRSRQFWICLKCSKRQELF